MHTVHTNTRELTSSHGNIDTLNGICVHREREREGERDREETIERANDEQQHTAIDET